MSERPDWGHFRVFVQEPGYIAIACLRCDVWDQFPMQASAGWSETDSRPVSERSVDLRFLDDWAAGHQRERHGERAP